VFVEGVQNQIATAGVVEAGEIAAVGVGDDGAIAAREGGSQKLADGSGLAGAGGADQFEMFGFIGRVDGKAGERERRGS
jgi:hypothetical protein